MGKIVAGLFLIAAAMLPFVTIESREFTNWDDDSNIVDNGPVRYLTATNVAWMFTHEIDANYIPVTWLSHALDWIIWGDSAWGHGLTNALLHALCSCLLVACLRRGGCAAPGAYLAGFLFAVHPVHAESVAWLSGRKDLLCSAALAACQFSYLGWRNESRRSSWWWSLAWLVVAGLCKPMAMSAIVALWLYDVVWRQRGQRDAFRSLIPHAAVCLIVAVVALYAQRSGGAVAEASDRRWGSTDRIGCNLAFQLLRCWLPFPFSPFLPNSLLEAVSDWLRWLVTAGLAGVSLLIALWARKNQIGKGFAWWWFGALAFLLPVSGVVPLGHTSLADRYLYLPSVGPCVFVAQGFAALARRALLATSGLAFASVLGLELLTHARAKAWANSFTLWQAAMEAFPHDELVWRNLTTAAVQAQRPAQAAATATKALQDVPDSAVIASNAAALLLQIGNESQAARIIAEAEARHPQSAEVQLQKGALAVRRKKPAEALTAYRKASELRPNWEMPYLDSIFAFEQQNDLSGAIAAAEQALVLAPKNQDAYLWLVELLGRDKRIDESLAVLVRLNRACPHFADGWKIRIRMLQWAGRHSEAKAVLREASRYVNLK